MRFKFFKTLTNHKFKKLCFWVNSRQNILSKITRQNYMEKSEITE